MNSGDGRVGDGIGCGTSFAMERGILGCDSRFDGTLLVNDGYVLKNFGLGEIRYSSLTVRTTSREVGRLAKRIN